METASPPVSPRVVARILMTQNARVISGTLLIAALLLLCMLTLSRICRVTRTRQGTASPGSLKQNLRTSGRLEKEWCEREAGR